MRARRLTIALAAANVAAAGLALAPFLAPHGAADAPSAAAPASGDEAPPLAPLPPQAEFAAITARPLFSPSRRPDQAALELAGGLAGRYRLIGVILGPDKGRALVAPLAGGRAIELGTGDALAGWTVRRIEQDRVVLSSPAGEATLAVSVPSEQK